MSLILVIADGLGVAGLTLLFTRHPDLADFFTSSVLVDVRPKHRKNNNHDIILQDSAAGATALATGQAVKTGQIGSSSTQTLSLLELARQKKNYAIAIMTDVEVCDATPAAFAARAKKRDEYVKIGKQIAAFKLDVLVGGYVESIVAPLFLNYVDNVMLVDSDVVVKDDFFDDVDAPVALLFPETKTDTEVIAVYTDVVLHSLVKLRSNKKKKKFVAVIEAGRVDRAAHAQDVKAYLCQIDNLADLLRVVRADFALHSKSTTVVFTSDHETGGIVLGGGNEIVLTTNNHVGNMVVALCVGKDDIFNGESAVITQAKLGKLLMKTIIAD
jgi:alkaline phosphatase